MADTKDIIKAALDQDAVALKQTVADLMLDKIRDAVEDRKAELAQQYFNAANPDFDQEEDPEDVDEADDDDLDVDDEDLEDIEDTEDDFDDLEEVDDEQEDQGDTDETA